jgi:hypothetical protein
VSDRGQAATRSSASTGARSKDERPHNSRQRRSDERREAYAARMAKVDSHLRQKVFRGWKKMFDECRREQPPGNSRQMPAPDPSPPPRREPPPQLARHPHGEEQAANLPPCTTDTDVQMAEGGEPPSSPRRDPAREEHAFLHAASDTLAGRRAGQPVSVRNHCVGLESLEKEESTKQCEFTFPLLSSPAFPCFPLLSSLLSSSCAAAFLLGRGHDAPQTARSGRRGHGDVTRVMARFARSAHAWC